MNYSIHSNFIQIYTIMNLNLGGQAIGMKEHRLYMADPGH